MHTTLLYSAKEVFYVISIECHVRVEIYHYTHQKFVVYYCGTPQCELFVRGTIGGSLVCDRNKRHPKKSFFYRDSLLYKFRWMPILVLIWVLYFILHEYSPRTAKKHVPGRIHKDVLIRIYDEASRRTHT